MVFPPLAASAFILFYRPLAERSCPRNVILSHMAGTSAIFRLNQAGSDEEAIALLREIQKNPVTDQILHIDLMEIPRGVPVTVAVTIQVIGTNATIKMGEGSVAMAINEVDISCLPSQLPDFLEVDVTDMELNDKILVSDLVTPVGEILTDPETMVLNIKAAAVFVEEEEETEEGEEGAEGEDGEDDEDGDEKKTEDKEKDKDKKDKKDK